MIIRGFCLVGGEVCGSVEGVVLVSRWGGVGEGMGNIRERCVRNAWGLCGRDMLENVWWNI